MAERRDLPLFAWGDALRAARRTRRRRRRIVAAIALGCAGIALPGIAPPLPLLLWNASASAPIGLYRIAPVGTLAVGDLVAARPPARARDLALRQHYLADHVPLVKRVAAVAGDRVCAAGALITINGRAVASRRMADRVGRPLPWWEGCRSLGAGTLFLLMAERGDSFDGRYFGVTPTADVIGKARLLWAR